MEKDSLNGLFSETRYDLNGSLKSKGIYEKYNSKKKKLLGYKSYYKSEKIHIDISYKKGKTDGYRLSYWENGILKRKDPYKRNKFIEGQCWNEKGIPVPYYDFEINPKFPEGQQALYKYITNKLDKNKIPKSAIGSKVIISFYVNKDGSISDVKLISGVDPLTNYEAIKAVMEMPKWIPAMQDGNPVRVKRVLPVSL